MKFVTKASVQSSTWFYRVLSVHYKSDVFLLVVSSLKTTFWLRRCDRSTSSSSSVISSEARPTEKVKMQHVNLKEKWRVDYPWLRTDMDMFCAMCQDTRQKNRFTRGSRNCGFWAFYKSGSYQGHSLCSQPTEYEGSFWCSMCQGKWLHLSSAAPVFSLGGGKGEGELTNADSSATSFVHCLACWPPTLTPPYRRSEILAWSLMLPSWGHTSCRPNPLTQQQNTDVRLVLTLHISQNTWQGSH